MKKKAKNDSFKLMNKPVLGKTMQKGRKHRDIKLVTTKYRRNYLESKPIITLQSFSQKIY